MESGVSALRNHGPDYARTPEIIFGGQFLEGCCVDEIDQISSSLES